MTEHEMPAAVRRHIGRFFAGHLVEEHVWTLGPVPDVLPRFRVLEFAPGPRSEVWVYASVGACEARPDPRLEFVLCAPSADLRHVELVTMIAWYHRQRGLGVGHTLPIGEPWLPGSACESLLVSRPYPFGPDLEICPLPEGHLHVLWLLPITAAERAFKVREGLDALEERFDAAGLEYCSPGRESVIPESEAGGEP